MVGTGTQDARVSLHVPGGISHDAYTGGVLAPHLVQNIPNIDFEVEVKFDGPMTSAYQVEGILVQQDANHIVRADFVHEQTSLQFYSAVIVNGVVDVRADVTIPLIPPLYVRLNRTGDTWTASYSGDGATWTVGATFTHAMEVTKIGPWAGNAGTVAPEFTALVDYFFNTSSPIVPEDDQGGFVAASVTQEPSDQTILVGETATFTALATGTAPISYQWQKNNVNISGATATSYTTPAVVLSDSGSVYRVIVANVVGSDTSIGAMLRVNRTPLPAITPNRIVVLGSSTAEGASANPLDSSWARKYARYIQTMYPASTLFNLAIGGFTTFNVMPTGFVPPAPWNRPDLQPAVGNNITRALELNPDLIIINLPTNDCNEYIPIAQQISNYDTVIALAAARGIEVYLSTSQPRNSDPATRALLIQLFAETNSRYGQRAIDFWSGLADTQRVHSARVQCRQYSF